MLEPESTMAKSATPDPASQPVELERHRLAFEQFYSLGPGRSYPQLAQKLGISASTAKLWCRTYGWRQRIQARDAEAAHQISDRSGQSSLDERERDLKIVRATKLKLTRDILDGKVKGRLSDIEMLIRLIDYLSGSQNDRLGWIDRETDPEKLRVRLRELAAEAESPPENPPPPQEPPGE